ncbi:MAG: aminotransferase class I/II-fold pyridoxal phosphate-dependent enzyme [Polyangiaceae bacterium]
MSRYDRLDTKLIHAGEPRPRIGGAVTVPIFQTSTFEQDSDTPYDDIRYARLSNTPNHDVLHAKLAALEGGEAALVTSSGMAAISTTLLALLRPGDHLIAQRCLYGGTHDLVTKDLADLGIEHSFVDGDDAEQWARALRPTTRAFYCESLTNPLLEVADLPSIVGFCQSHGLVSVIDNTFTSPVCFRPLEHGFDVVLHSATKYLGGHSDVVAGAVIGRSDVVEHVRQKLNHLGACLEPFGCFLLHRGLKTLALRVRHQSGTASTLAHFLSKHEAIATVYHPSLATHPQQARARALFDAMGGVLSFTLKDTSVPVERFIRKLDLPVYAPSLGGVESLITGPARSSHAGMSAKAREERGIIDGLIRLSVGLEAASDLMMDLHQALDPSEDERTT